jgi:catalase (peroxidase I)
VKNLAFQHPLPEPSGAAVDVERIKVDLKGLMTNTTGGEFIRLAYQCASTFRATDYRGGCNGARIRFPPGSEWPINAGLDQTLALLEPIKRKYGVNLSYADLIVLAGNVAAETIGSPKLKFCPGRTDAADGSGWEGIEYGITEPPKTVKQEFELLQRRGQTYKDYVALSFPNYRSAKMLRQVLKAPGDYPEVPSNVCPRINNLLTEAIKYYPEVRFWAEYFATAPPEMYGIAFAESWTRLMNADRFDGPVGNVCA